MGNMRNAYELLAGNPEGKRSLGRHKRRWKDNIRIDMREISWEGVDWIHLAQDRGQWWARANALIYIHTFGFHKRREIS
jgi:hypothetical protein